MDAEIIVRFIAKNICEPKDLNGRSFSDLVRDLIASEGLLGIADEDAILSIRDITKAQGGTG